MRCRRARRAGPRSPPRCAGAVRSHAWPSSSASSLAFGMPGSHEHGHSHLRAGARHKGRLWAALALLGTVTVVEVVAGFLTNSLALLSDAGHMLTDVGGLGMALAAIHVADRSGHDRQRTFGLYRLEILAALANAVLLFAVALYVMIERSEEHTSEL